MIKCGEFPLPDSTDADDYVVAYGIMVDLYRNCALRHNTLVDSVEEHNNGGR